MKARNRRFAGVDLLFGGGWNRRPIIDRNYIRRFVLCQVPACRKRRRSDGRPAGGSGRSAGLCI